MKHRQKSLNVFPAGAGPGVSLSGAGIQVLLLGSLPKFTPQVAGQGRCLDPGACPGPDPGFAGVTIFIDY